MNDFDASVFILTVDNELIYANEYISLYDGECVFIVLTNDKLNSEYNNDNTIYIEKNWNKHMHADVLVDTSVFQTKDCARHDVLNSLERSYSDHIRDKMSRLIWQADFNIVPNTVFIQDKENAENDFDGYIHTDNILRYAKYMLELHNKKINNNNSQRSQDEPWYSYHKLHDIESMFPAVYASYYSTIEFQNETIHGFVPAAGQMMTIEKNMEDVNYAISKLDEDIPVFSLRKITIWTSTESTYRTMWICDTKRIEENYKVNPFAFVFPIYDCKTLKSI